MIDSVGSYFSITSLANTLSSAGIKANPVTIGNYIEYLKIDREFKNLEMIKDNYRKIAVTLDPVSFGNRSGVEHFRAWEWIK